MRGLQQEEALQRLRYRGLKEVQVRPTRPPWPSKLEDRWRVIQQRPQGEGYLLIVAQEMAPKGGRE